MKISWRPFRLLAALCFIPIAGGAALAQTEDKPFEPIVGQEGKDVVWVSTPHVLVEKMLDIARVTRVTFVPGDM